MSKGSLAAFVAACALVALAPAFPAVAASPDAAELAYADLRSAAFADWSADGALFIRTKKALFKIAAPAP